LVAGDLAFFAVVAPVMGVERWRSRSTAIGAVACAVAVLPGVSHAADHRAPVAAVSLHPARYWIPVPLVPSYVYVSDVDAVHRRAIDAGAQSIQAPNEAVHGDRMATVVDRFGNQWAIASRIEQISVDELHRRLRRVDDK
jgi:hypothetical protein